MNHRTLGRLASLAFAAALGSSALAQNFNSNQTDVRIPLPGQSGGSTAANSPAGSFPITFTVSGAGSITSDVNLTLNFGTRVSTSTVVGGPDDFPGREHTFFGDLDMLLVSPTGASVFFLSDAGGSNNARGTYVFDDEAAGLIPSATVGTSADPVPNGSYQVSAYTPTENFSTFGGGAPAPGYGTAFSAFDGLNPNGTWRLYILDDAGGDWGYLNGATLNLTAVPEPATLVLLGSGVALLLRRRRK
jgi:hypothetical protein